MPKVNTRMLKVELNTGQLSADDINSLQQWENEGGRSGDMPDFLKSLRPLRRGDIFEVLASDITYEDGKLYLTAEIDILARG